MNSTPVQRFKLIHDKEYQKLTINETKNFRKLLHDENKLDVRRLEWRSTQVKISHRNDGYIGFKVERNALAMLQPNHDLVIECSGEDSQKSTKAKVIEVNDDCVKIHLNKPEKLVKNDSKTFKIQLDDYYIKSRYNRVSRAISKFGRISCNIPVHNCLAGTYDDMTNLKYPNTKTITLEGSPTPDHIQKVAISQSMSRRISLIEGGCGTGKTLVAANIACSMSRIFGKRVLLCSPVQSTVDKLSRDLWRSGCVSVIQIPTSNETSAKSNICQGCSLDNSTRNAIFDRNVDRYKKIRRMTSERKLRDSAIKLTNNSSPFIVKKFERKLLRKADVVCCNLEQALSPQLQDLTFDMLIIDDAQLTLRSTGVAVMILSKAKQVTLIGEPCRKSTYLKLVDAKTLDWTKLEDFESKTKDRRCSCYWNLFEKLKRLGIATVELKQQYRSHQNLFDFANDNFYFGRVSRNRTTESMLHQKISSDLAMGELNFKWLPDKLSLTAMVDVSINHRETIHYVVEMIVKTLVKRDYINQTRISIICNRIARSNEKIEGVEVGSIEDFYGRENDYVILLAELHPNSIKDVDIEVLMSRQPEVMMQKTWLACDFLMSGEALKVAITRARLGVFIVADLSKDKQDSMGLHCRDWIKLVETYKARNLIITEEAFDINTLKEL